MSVRSFIDRLKCQRGAALIEFAILLIPLLMLIIGTLELGYRIYATAVVEGALRDVARMASTGTYTGSAIDNSAAAIIHKFRHDAAVTITKKSYSDFTGVGVAEPITKGSVDSGSYCYDDINGNSQWDADQGKSGLGNPDDVVYYDIQVSYPTLFSFSQIMFGLPATTTIDANTLVSNEPFAPDVATDPKELCV